VANDIPPAVPPIPLPPEGAVPPATRAPARPVGAPEPPEDVAPEATAPPAPPAAPAPPTPHTPPGPPVPPSVAEAGYATAPEPPNPYAEPTPYVAPGAYTAPAAYGTPNPYATAPSAYGTGASYGQPQGLAIASLVTGIVGILGSFIFLGFLPGVAAVILGHLAQKRQPYARGFWLTGLITGYISAAIGLLIGAVFIFYIIAASAWTSPYN